MKSHFLPILLLASSPPALAQTPNLTSAEFLPGTPVIAPAAGAQRRPAIAAGLGSSLLVFEDDRAGDFDLFAQRIDSNGAPLDPVPFPIWKGPGEQTRPLVSWNGSSWLVVFSNQVDPGSGYFAHEVAAMRVDIAGNVLDPAPIGLMVDSSGVAFAVTSDGSNWAVLYTGFSGGNSGLNVRRVSAAGAVLDPVPVEVRPETFTLSTDLQVGFANGTYLFAWNESAMLGRRFTSSLQPLDANPRTIVAVGGKLRSAANQWLVVRSATTPIFTSRIEAQRLDANLNLLDANPIAISDTAAGYFPTEPRVVHDGSRWIIGWTSFGGQIAHLARLTTQGSVLDPGGVQLPIGTLDVLYDHTLGALPGGGAVFAWDDIRNLSTLDVFTLPMLAGGTLGVERCQSLGAERMDEPRVTAGLQQQLVTWRAESGVGSRVLAQRVDRLGRPLDAEPIVVHSATHNRLFGGGSAWNGDHFLVVWNDLQDGTVWARRLGTDGQWLGASFFVQLGWAPDVAALGGDFLVTALRAPSYPQFIYSFAMRVSGAGALLDPAPINVGPSYATRARVVELGGRWLVVTESHWSHNESQSGLIFTFVDPTGATSTQTSAGIYNVQLRGSIDVASSGTNALLVCPSGSNWTNTEVQAALVEPDGTLQFTNRVLTGAAGMGQFRPTVSFDGRHYVVGYETYENNAWFYDFEPDVFALRLEQDGTPVDGTGFPLWDGEDHERSVDATSLGEGKTLFAVAAFDDTRAAMRIAVRSLRPAGLANYGLGTSGCEGPLRIDASREPRIGTPGFTLRCDRAPAGGAGLFVLGGVPDVAGSDPLGYGVLFHIDPTPPNLVRLLPTVADADGLAARVVPVPPSPALIGRTLYFQAAFDWSATCLPSSSGYATSDGLAVTVRP